jgi:hypothetical protein
MLYFICPLLSSARSRFAEVVYCPLAKGAKNRTIVKGGSRKVPTFLGFEKMATDACGHKTELAEPTTLFWPRRSNFIKSLDSPFQRGRTMMFRFIPVALVAIAAGQSHVSAQSPLGLRLNDTAGT